MILRAVPGTLVLGSSAIRLVLSFNSATLADFATRGFAISFRTLARVVLSDCFLFFFCGIRIHAVVRLSRDARARQLGK